MSYEDAREHFYLNHVNASARVMMSPYPTFEIDIPKDYWVSNIIEQGTVSCEIKLKADIYLTCINSLVKNYEPKERDVFFSSFQNDNLDSPSFGTRFVSSLFKILESYPKLKRIIYSGKNIIIDIDIYRVRFDCWSFTNQKKFDVMGFLRTLILEAFGLPRNNLIRDWKDDEKKPRTENYYLGKQDCSYYDNVIHPEHCLTDISTKVVWAPRNNKD